MREILFRGKCKDNGEWVQGDLLLDQDLEQAQIVWFDYKSYKSTEDGVERYVDGAIVDPETVGQYTGLTDKNGVKIFEGDIVKLTDDYNDFEWKAVVVFGNPGGAYCWGWNFLPIDGYKGTTDILMWVEMEATGAYCEVIGNIYDNPELLEGSVENG